MLEQLQTHLSTIIKNIKGQGKISESNVSDVLRDIRIALLEADVNLKVAKKFVENGKLKRPESLAFIYLISIVIKNGMKISHQFFLIE